MSGYAFPAEGIAMAMVVSITLGSCSSLSTATCIVDTTTIPRYIPDTHGLMSTISAQDAARLAILNSSELRAKNSSLEIREGAWKLGLRSFLPGIEIRAGSDERLAMFGTDTVTKTLSATVKQPVWDGGRLALSRNLEMAEIDLAKSELDREARNLGETAVAAYRTVVAGHAHLEMKKASMEYAIRQREVLAAELSLGLSMAMDLLETDLSLADLETGILESELEISIAEAELAEVIGVMILPTLSERLESDSAIINIETERVVLLAEARSPELQVARYKVARKRGEAKAAALAWLPSIGIQVIGQVGGSSFPLTRASWSCGITMEFSGPYLNADLGTSTGGELPSDSTAHASMSLEPLPDLVGALGWRSALLALKLEEERYKSSIAMVARNARIAVLGYTNAVEKREINLKKRQLARSRLELSSVKVDLGKAVRSELIGFELEFLSSEIELLESLAALVAAEREIEKLLDIAPGELAEFLSIEGDNRTFPGSEPIQ
jgi:outer membrane protein TolC